MNSVGIIVNPSSGKDIRRITSSAFTVSNSEKENIVERIILSMVRLGVTKVYLMPDTSNLNLSIMNKVNHAINTKCQITLLDYFPSNRPEDTIKAMSLMENNGIDCMIILGGDGTVRLAAKARVQSPILPISTGTNNVYPYFEEGTSIGCAAAFICSKSRSLIFRRDKLIQVTINNEISDVALVDAVITRNSSIGSKAIYNLDDIDEIIVCRTKPNSIGFSAMIGCIRKCNDSDKFGWRTKINENAISILAPTGAGQITKLKIEVPTKLLENEIYLSKKEYNGTIALDGERTLSFRRGDIISFRVTRENGLRKVNTSQILKEAIKEGFFIAADE